MEIKIRGINPHAVKKIDELAKEKNLSRNEYLKNVLEELSFIEMNDNVNDRMEKQIQINNIVLKKNTDSMDELVNVLKELL
ncbi:hypothetical protein NM897_17375 (plasmid) [Planococcus maritimus]|uniref:hypothetical protein n=1 Tax=Planococcus maritimus TaxID=192421 RepID=UPI00313A32A0